MFADSAAVRVVATPKGQEDEETFCVTTRNVTIDGFNAIVYRVDRLWNDVNDDDWDEPLMLDWFAWDNDMKGTFLMLCIELVVACFVVNGVVMDPINLLANTLSFDL